MEEQSVEQHASPSLLSESDAEQARLRFERDSLKAKARSAWLRGEVGEWIAATTEANFIQTQIDEMIGADAAPG